jgi:superoxide dismutase, Fe-Mn family
VWNHTFYWNSLKPKGGGKPTGAIATAINESFGDYDAFRKQFVEAATTQFGSGWAWLVREGGKLKIVKTPNAETPLTTAAKPILTIDVWEHAYYIDFRNARPKYIDTYLDHLANWEFASANL